MAPTANGGLLDSGEAAEVQELSSWQSSPRDNENGHTTSAKRSRGLLNWLFRGPGSTFGSDTPKPLRPTAYLDGLRGFAAFLVYIHHHELWVHSATTDGQSAMFENAYGHNGNYRFACLPFIRNFFTGGHIAVAVFYVISGYVLSAKGLSLIQSGDLSRLFDSLASSVFRRWFRLYVPIIITTFVYVTILNIFGIWTCSYVPKSALLDEWWEWYVQSKNFSFLFKEGFIWVEFNTHLWSIPLEMRGSIVVFCALLSLAHATTRARLLCTIALVVYFLYIVDGYYGSLFMMGMLQCDLDLLAQRDHTDFPTFLRRLEPYKTTIAYAFFTLGMFLAGVPSKTTKVEDLRANPGWYWLSFLKPQAVFDYKWFFLFWASSMIVFSVRHISWLRRFFETRFCQYFGRNSYALYLVHGPVLSVIGDRVYHIVGWVRPIEEHQKMLAPYINVFPLSNFGPMGLEISFLVPQLLLMPVTFYVTELVTTYVDDTAVRWAGNFYKKIQGEGSTKSGVPPLQPEEVMRLA